MIDSVDDELLIMKSTLREFVIGNIKFLQTRILEEKLNLCYMRNAQIIIKSKVEVQI